MLPVGSLWMRGKPVAVGMYRARWYESQAECRLYWDGSQWLLPDADGELHALKHFKSDGLRIEWLKV